MRYTGGVSMREPERFWSKVDVGELDECWEWLAGKDRNDYGQFWVRRGLWQAHRVAWVLTYGPIPEGLFVCHHCDNSSCVNPYHLFLGTNADNVADSARKGRRAKGEKNGSSKLTKEEVLDIRDLYATGEWTQQELADEFGVSNPAISYLLSRRTWAWLP